MSETRTEAAKRRRAERCEHFTGTQNEACKAGHRYAEIGRPFPCLAPYDGAERPGCPDLLLPTAEQLEAREREMRRFLENMGKARTAIVAHIEARGKKDRDDAGTLPCPCCEGGTLAYRYAGAYNGHIHARCSTEGCVAWME